MKEAKLYEKLEGKAVKCIACSNYCTIAEGKTGACGVRRNIGGKLQLMVYGKAAAVALDPVEKKPLFHFLPGTSIFSIGTLGCNFGCDFCQNWEMSQAPKEGRTPQYWGDDWPPEKIVNGALKSGASSLAYTYNEPTIFFEYAEDTALLGKKKGLKNVFVSNGFSSKEAVARMRKFVDADNVDLKSFTDSFYGKLCKARLEPVLENISALHKAGIWIEVTTLVIPGQNDSRKELEEIADFIAGVSENIPWHVSAFYPSFRMTDVPPTTHAKLLEAYEIGKKAGLKFVYVGNVPDAEHESTFCPECGEKLIERIGYNVRVSGLNNGKCGECGERIPGVWK